MATITFRVPPEVPFQQVEATVRVALAAVESICGKTAVDLDVRCLVDEQDREVAISGRRPISAYAARAVAGLLSRQFGDSLVVQHAITEVSR